MDSDATDQQIGWMDEQGANLQKETEEKIHDDVSRMN